VFFEKVEPQITKGFLDLANAAQTLDRPSKKETKLRNEIPECLISKVPLLKEPKEYTLKLPRKKRFLNFAFNTAFSNLKLQPTSKAKSTESNSEMKFLLEKRELQFVEVNP
jgi:hypothetical protein